MCRVNPPAYMCNWVGLRWKVLNILTIFMMILLMSNEYDYIIFATKADCDRSIESRKGWDQSLVTFAWESCWSLVPAPCVFCLQCSLYFSKKKIHTIINIWDGCGIVSCTMYMAGMEMFLGAWPYTVCAWILLTVHTVCTDFLLTAHSLSNYMF